MTRPIHLAVFGVPEPMGSKRGFAHNGRVQIVDSKKMALRSWQTAIGQAARDWLRSETYWPPDEPVTVRAVFFLLRPKSKPSWYEWPDTRPDIDKLARSVLDPLTGLIWRDDSQVVRLKVTKRYADARPPGVDITITPLGRQLSPRARRRLEEDQCRY